MPHTVDVSPCVTPIEYTLILISAGSQKAKVLKILSTLSGQGLVTCKQWVDACPFTLLEDVREAEALEWKEAFVGTDAVLTIKAF